MPSTALVNMTWLDLCRSVAWSYHIDLNMEQADVILWEFTAFPMGDKVLVEEQLHEFFTNNPQGADVVFLTAPAAPPDDTSILGHEAAQ